MSLCFLNFTKLSLRIKHICFPQQVKLYSSFQSYSYMQRFFCNYESNLRICICLPHHLVKRNGVHSSSSLKNKNEVERILSIPENKLNQLNIINSSEIMHTIKELENFRDFVTETDMKKLSELTYHAVQREFHTNTNLTKIFWTFLTSFKDFNFTSEHLSVLLSICLKSPHQIMNKDILTFMEDHDLKINQETAELLLASLCQQGDCKEAEGVLALMQSQQLTINEKIFSSLLLLRGKNRDFNGIQNVLNAMESNKIKASSMSQSAMVMAYNLCEKFEEAKAVLETVKKCDTKFTQSQYCDIILSFVLSGSCKDNNEHLNYILNSKLLVVGDIDLKNVIQQLIHSNFAAEAILILSTQQSYLENPHLNSNGSIFIEELVTSKHTKPALVVELCNEIVRKNVNMSALQVALEVALSERHIELSWELLKALKRNGAPVREHFFWPLFALQHPNDDRVEKTLSILDGMVELGVNLSSETLQQYVIPNLPLDDPELALIMLSKVGISKTKSITSLLAVLLSKLMMKEALELANRCYVNFSLEDLMKPLASAYRKVPTEVLEVLKALISKYDEKNLKEGSTKKDYGGQFLISVFKSSKHAMEDEEIRLLTQGLEENGISFSTAFMEGIVNKDAKEDSKKEENEGENSALTSKDRKVFIPHPDRMTLEELECHLIELKEKKMNTRGVLRKLLVKYSAVKKEEKVSEIIRELKVLESDFGPGMLSSVFNNKILQNDAEGALETFYILKTEFPTFLIDSYKVVDLCCLLVRQNRVQESVDVMKEYVEKIPKKFLRKKAIVRNCHNLLMECVRNDGYSTTKKMCSLLLKGGLADPSPVILGPLIKARLNSNDLAGAVQEAEELYSTYRVLSMRTEILIHLMKNLNTGSGTSLNVGKYKRSDLEELVERMVALITESRGMRQAKEDILCAILETGDATEAARVFKSVEESLSTERIHRLCNQFVRYEKKDCLLLLFSISKCSSVVDRPYICECLLNIYIIQRDREAASSLWSQIVEEGLRPLVMFTNKLSKFLAGTS